MKKKRMFKALRKRALSVLLAVSMIAPQTCQIAAFAAETLENMPRHVSFDEPDPLTLEDLGIATDSNVSENEGLTSAGSQSHAAEETELRGPERFYDDSADEPDGILVQFDEEKNIRTYMQGENEYVTVIGGYSGLYRDENGNVRRVDNTLVNSDMEEEDHRDTASSSNARAYSMFRAVRNTSYSNEAGNLDVTLPARMTRQRGYTLSDGEDSLEIIPLAGNYSESIAEGSAIRYNNVFENVDIQYTVIGDMVKEDIILLEKQERNEFSYRLESDTLKFKKQDEAVFAYAAGADEPKFALTAPLMIDAAGNVSKDILLTYDASEKVVTYTADEAWLNDEEREYPVRIDPAGAVLVEYSAFRMNMVAKGGGFVHTPDANTRHFDSSVNPMVGFSSDYGYCRMLMYISPDWEALIANPETQPDEDGNIKNVELELTVMTTDTPDRTPFSVYVPGADWDPETVTWDSMRSGGVDSGMTSPGSPQYSVGSNQKLQFDITEIYYKWLENGDTRHGLLLQAEVEANGDIYVPGESDPSLVSWAETFYNETYGAEYGPKLQVSWTGTLNSDALGTMDMSEFSLMVDPGVARSDAGGRNTLGILAHGASQAESVIEYEVYEKESGDAVLDGETTAGDSVDCPDFTEIDEGCYESRRKDSNWQSGPIMTDDLRMDTIYYIEAKGTGKEVIADENGEPALGEADVESEVLRSDEFLLYEVQASDILPRIARHYGVTTNQISEDNQMGFQLAEAGNVLFIRNPKTNEPYTAALSDDKLEEFIRYCLYYGMNPRCMVDGEPVNMSTGSFYMSQTDASFEDLNGEFAIARAYNGLTPYFRSEFGMGWNSMIGERIMVLADGSVLFTKEDGQALVFTCDGGEYTAPDGYDYVLRPLGWSAGKPETAGFATDSNAAAPEETAEDKEAGRIEAVPPSMGWEITEPDGTVREFNAYGLLTSKTNRKGHTTSYTYDSDYLLTEITAPSGKSYGVTMEAGGKITRIALPDGESISYEYDNDNNLISVTNPEGNVRRYEYDDEHRMTAWYDENGNRVIENILDDMGRVISQTDALGGIMTFVYEDGRTTITDNNGNKKVYLLDGELRNIGILYADGDSERTEYSDDNRIAAVTDANGVTTRYTYDDNGNILTEVREDGSKAQFTYNELNLPTSAADYEGNTTVFTYDEAGNLLSVTDGEGNQTQYSYDELSRLASVTDANGGVTVFAYDGTGAPVVSMTDAMGSKTTFTYDKMHNLLTGEDSLGNTLAYAYDENYNKVSETDAEGNVTRYVFDGRGRNTTVIDALNNEISYLLDGNGNVVSSTDRRGNSRTVRYDKVLNLPVSITDEMGNTIRYTYDRNGNVTGVKYSDGSTVSYSYDRAGRMVSMTAQNGLVTKIEYDGNGNMIRISDDETRVYRFVYDKNNRLVKAVDALGGVIQYAYDGNGNQIQVTDENNHATAYAYDAVGRLTEIKDALGGIAASSYDLEGRLLSVTDQNGNTMNWHYDAIGRILAQADAAQNITAFEYDSLGNVTKMTDALKGETKSEADALSRVVKTTDAEGGVYEYQYDENGNLVKAVMADKDTISMVYDAANRMTRYTDEAGVVTYLSYDSMGRVVKAQDTAGNVMTYSYDESGNLVKQTDTIERSAVYEYDKFGRLTSVTGTDLAATSYAYDALDRLILVTQADGTEYSYEYDAAGNLTGLTEPGEAVYTYTYDAINRLTNKVNPLGAATTFRYDAKGNLIGSTDAEGVETSYTYDVIDRLTAFTDGRGNTTSYEYDGLSRLLSYTTPEGNKEEYRYDVLGNLTKRKDANGLITEYVYDIMGNLIREISPKGAVTSYTYDKHDELTSIQDPAGNLTKFDVDMNRLVTKMTQKNGGEYTYTYDAVHRLTDIQTPLGLKTTLTYDAADNIVKQADSLGRENTFEYDIMHRMTKSVNAEGGVTIYGYDVRGNQNQLTDALGFTWNYRYDLVDQLTASVDPEGKATEFVYNLVGEIASVTKPGGRITSVQYDKNYNITGIVDPKGYLYEYTYDRDNRLTRAENPLGETETVVYDAGSRVTSVTDRMGLTEKYTYDPHGNVIESQAANGLITKFGYDILDNLVKVTLPSGLTAAYTYDVMGNVTSATDTMKRVSLYTYDVEGNMTSVTDYSGRTERMAYDEGGRIVSYISNGGNQIHYDYDRLNGLVEKSYEDARDPEKKEGVLYGYDILGQRVSMMDRSGESTYEYDGLGRITKVTTGSGETTVYAYDECDQLASITYPDGKKVSYRYDKNDNLTEVTDRTGAVTTYVYDEINRITEIHRPNGVSTYNTYNARDQIVSMKNICDDCGWVVSRYEYTYDDRSFITGEKAVKSLYGYAWDDKHDGKHENGRHDDLFPHGGQHTNKHAKDGEYNFQIVETVRSFEYDDDGKLLRAVEDEEQQGRYVYTFQYDDMGNRTFYSKARNSEVQESAEYTYNSANQLTAVREYDGKHYKNVEYTYDADGNRILEEEVKADGTRKVEKRYEYTVENRLKAVYDKNDLLTAMAYDGDGNRIFQLNYNLHTDDDWKGSSGNGNGNNKDNSGIGNSGSNSGNGTGSAAAVSAEDEEKGLLDGIISFFTGESENSQSNGNKNKEKGNDGNDKNNGVGNGNGNSGNNGNGNGNSGNNGNGNGNSGNNGNGNGNSGNNGNGNGNSGNNGNGNGNTSNTGGSTNQSGILFPIAGEVSELEEELIGMIKTTGKQKNYELIEYVNDVNREYVEVLMELNINGIMDTAYSYGNERLTNERFTGWTGYYTYDIRGSVSGVTDSEGMIWQSYRYDGFGNLTFGKPQYNNVYSYNAESYNPNVDVQYLRARYYSPKTADFLTEDSYLGNIIDPLTLNRYNYVKSSPLNYIDPSGHDPRDAWDAPHNYLPDDREMARMGSDFYEQWSDLYRNAQTTDQKWELIDFKNTFLRETDGTLIQDIADFIVENPVYGGGAIAGGALCIVILIGSGGTAGMAGAPFMTAAFVTAGMAGGGAIFGTSYNEYKKGEIEKELRQKYDVDISNIKLYNLDQMPEEVWELCEEYTDYERKNQLYEDLSMRALQFAMVLYAAEAVYQMGITLEEYLANRNADKMGAVVEGGSNSNSPQSFLQRALKNQEIESTPNRFKETWIEGDYKYTVRIHEGNTKYTDASSIYRVSRQNMILDSNGQGNGLEYLGTDGNWYHQSVLTEFFKGGTPNPNFNENAARITHIAIKGGK